MSLDFRNDAGSPNWNVRQLARRLVFKLGARDIAREICEFRRASNLRSPPNTTLRSGFRRRETPPAGQGIAHSDRRVRRAGSLRAGVQPQHPWSLEECARLGIASGLYLGHGV